MDHDEAAQTLAGLQAQLESALAGYELLSANNPTFNYAPPDGWQQLGAIAALAEMLFEADVLDRDEWAIRTKAGQLAALESSLAAAAEHLRQTTGLIIPLGLAMRPQG